MSRDDEACLKLGREIVRMIHDVRRVAAGRGDVGYGRRKVTFPGGEAHIIVANDAELADAMERAATASYNVESVAPPSQRN